MLKQVIVFRGDLLNHPKITIGKIASQIAHASMLWLAHAAVHQPMNLSDLDKEWLTQSMTKIVTVCADEKELTELYIQLGAANIAAYLVVDEGRTVFSEPTLTALATRPVESSAVDKITRKLKLLR